MKIGILTLHEADSYGAVLQAYALQKTLEKLGAKSALLSFRRKSGPSAGKSDASPAPLLRIREASDRRRALFAGFRQAHLACAPTVPWEEANNLNAIYDRFLVGSDQVWNPQIPGVDERYFLPFAAPEKRFSYAASFGADELPDRLRAWCGDQLASFQGLSVREESGKRLVRKLTGREAVICLDPTLLLAPNDWDPLLLEPEDPNYALLFLLSYDAALAARARSAAAAQGLKLKVCTASFIPAFGFEAWDSIGVERWLSLIKYACCVFTNSFHGAVFSLIFGRPLAMSRLSENLQARNGRIEELLHLAGMDGALEQLCPPPLPTELYKRLAPKREISLCYLKELMDSATI